MRHFVQDRQWLVTLKGTVRSPIGTGKSEIGASPMGDAMRADRSGFVRGCAGERSAPGGGSGSLPISGGEKGAVAAEFVLLTSLIAAVAVGLMAALGAWVEQPLGALVSTIVGFTGVN
jgi:Flp pilus assembly pilin Flp